MANEYVLFNKIVYGSFFKQSDWTHSIALSGGLHALQVVQRWRSLITEKKITV